jgi:hypothetical protein
MRHSAYYAGCRNAECSYADCRYAERHGAIDMGTYRESDYEICSNVTLSDQCYTPM